MFNSGTIISFPVDTKTLSASEFPGGPNFDDVFELDLHYYLKFTAINVADQTEYELIPQNNEPYDASDYNFSCNGGDIHFDENRTYFEMTGVAYYNSNGHLDSYSGFNSDPTINLEIPCNVPTGNYVIKVECEHIDYLYTNIFSGTMCTYIESHGSSNASFRANEGSQSGNPDHFLDQLEYAGDNSLNLLPQYSFQGYSITNPNPTPNPLNLSLTTTFATCDQNLNSPYDDGEVVLNATGGSSPYLYSLDGGVFGTNNSFTNLAVGQHTATVMDNSGCAISETFEITTHPFEYTVSITEADCGLSNGQIDVSFSSAPTPISIHWTDESFTPLSSAQGQGTTNVSGLPVGMYEMNVLGNDGCQINDTFDITNPYSLAYNINTNDACTENTGFASVTGLNGSGPYSYEWADGSTSSSTNCLPTGLQTVTVIDANNCESTKSFTINLISSSNFDVQNNIAIDGVLNSIPGTSGSEVRIRGRLVLNEGAELTLTNQTLSFAYNPLNTLDQGLPNNGVVIKQNAVLNATNVIFRGIPNCDFLWDGIEVWGYDQPTTVPGGGTGVDGDSFTRSVVSPLGSGVFNADECVVRDAEIGIALYRKGIPFGTGAEDYEYGRGLLLANDCNFINNLVSVDFKAKTLVTNNSIISGSNFLNNSYLKGECQFGQRPSDVFIQLESVQNPIIEGNTFKGNEPFSIDERVTGIRSYDAAYEVKRQAVAQTFPIQYVPNSFQDLFKGIDVYGIGGLNGNVVVNGNRFVNTFQGISMGAAIGSEVVNNFFDVPVGNQSFNSWAIHAASNDASIFAENRFHSLGNSPYTFGYINDQSEIIQTDLYKNTFAGDFEAATQIMGDDNSQIQIDCNQYQGDNAHDWVNLSPNLAEQGFCDILSGDNTVNNLFASCNPTTNNEQIFTNQDFTYNTRLSFAPDPNCIINSSAQVTVVTCGSSTSLNEVCPSLLENDCIGCEMIAIDVLVNDVLSSFNRHEVLRRNITMLVARDSVEKALDLINNTNSRGSEISIATFLVLGEYDLAKQLVNSSSASSSEMEFYEWMADIGLQYGTVFNLDSLSNQDLVNLQLYTSESGRTGELALNFWNRANRNNRERLLPPSPSSYQTTTHQNAITEVNVFPNPSLVNGSIRLTFTENTSQSSFQKISIFDLAGKQIETNIKMEGQSVSVDGLGSGVYLLSIELNNGEQAFKKVIVE